MEGFPFFDAATGSLGQGLSIAAGVAEGARLDGTARNVYCIIGDGEAREGQIAEALDYIVDRKLRNVLPIFNCNDYGQADRVSNPQHAETHARKLEAAGFDVILVETVGVGQSEVAVSNMVDTFVFLTLARTGDQLQGIKKGVLELADVVVVNKADGRHAIEAKAAARELAAAIRLIYPRETVWRPPVLTLSALEGDGLPELWDTVLKHRDVLTAAGVFDARRRAQQVDWTWSMVRDTVLDRVLTHPAVRRMRAEIERQVLDGELTPALAAQQILDAADG
jgi:LAO/AO transport system ATPase